jgi:hypothetical protein
MSEVKKEVVRLFAGLCLFSPVLTLMATGYFRLIGIFWLILLSSFTIDTFYENKELKKAHR